MPPEPLTSTELFDFQERAMVMMRQSASRGDKIALRNLAESCVKLRARLVVSEYEEQMADVPSEGE